MYECMRIKHTTLLRNLPSIREYGLLRSFSRDRRSALWFHATAWDRAAETHVRLRHDADGEDLVHLTFHIPDEWLRRHAGNLWYCLEDVGPERLERIQVVRRVLEEMPV